MLKRPEFCVGDKVLLYHPKDIKGPLRNSKLAFPNKGLYVIIDITKTNVFVVPEDHPKSTAKCIAWNCIQRCPAEWTKENFLEESESEDAQPEDVPTPTAPASWKVWTTPLSEDDIFNEDVKVGEGGV